MVHLSSDIKMFVFHDRFRRMIRIRSIFTNVWRENRLALLKSKKKVHKMAVFATSNFKIFQGSMPPDPLASSPAA